MIQGIIPAFIMRNSAQMGLVLDMWILQNKARYAATFS